MHKGAGFDLVAAGKLPLLPEKAWESANGRPFFKFSPPI